MSLITVDWSFISGQLNVAGYPLAAWHPMDSGWLVLEDDWVLGEWSDKLRQNLEVQRLAGYKPEKWDCEDHARNAWDFMCKCHAMNPDPATDGLGIAFGWLKFMFHGQYKHANNIYVNEKYQLRNYEPQKFGITELTREERQSCDLGLI